MNDTYMETANAIERYMLDVGRRARAASRVVGCAETRTKNGALLAIAAALEADEERLLAANRLDMDAGRANGLDAALLDRLELTPSFDAYAYLFVASTNCAFGAIDSACASNGASGTISPFTIAGTTSVTTLTASASRPMLSASPDSVRSPVSRSMSGRFGASTSRSVPASLSRRS